METCTCKDEANESLWLYAPEVKTENAELPEPPFGVHLKEAKDALKHFFNRKSHE